DAQNDDFRGPEFVVGEFYRGAMPYWSDLTTKANLTQALVTLTVAPDTSAFAIQWETGQCCTSGTEPPVRTFEVVFYNDGRIRYDYPGPNPVASGANPAFIGLSGGVGLQSLDVV